MPPHVTTHGVAPGRPGSRGLESGNGAPGISPYAVPPGGHGGPSRDASHGSHHAGSHNAALRPPHLRIAPSQVTIVGLQAAPSDHVGPPPHQNNGQAETVHQQGSAVFKVRVAWWRHSRAFK